MTDSSPESIDQGRHNAFQAEGLHRLSISEHSRQCRVGSCPVLHTHRPRPSPLIASNAHHVTIAYRLHAATSSMSASYNVAAMTRPAGMKQRKRSAVVCPCPHVLMRQPVVRPTILQATNTGLSAAGIREASPCICGHSAGQHDETFAPFPVEAEGCRA